MKRKIVNLLIIWSILTLISAQSFFKQAESEKIDDRPDRHLFWGHYKPNRLSVVTQRSKSPLSVGFMYSEDIPINTTHEQFELLLRERVGPSSKHTSADYLVHDGATYSKQHIVDKELNLEFDITFFKTKPEEIIQQSWVYLIEPKPLSTSDPEKLFNSFLYISGETLDGKGLNTFELIETSPNRYRILAFDRTLASLKGFFDVEFIPFKPATDSLIPDDTDLTEEQIAQYRELWKLQNPGVAAAEPTIADKPVLTLCHFDVPPLKAWRHSKYIFNALIDDQEAGIMTFDEKDCKAKITKFNIAVLQVRGYPGYKLKVTHQSINKPVHITTTDISLYSSYYMDELNAKLEKTFPIQDAPTKLARQQRKALREAAVSNLLGGLSYSFGRVKTIPDVTSSTPTQEEYELFTATPSRSEFPRGFLWDEGFHLLVLCRWDRVLCLEIIKHWFGTMTLSGWIPREQARGEEQESSHKSNRFLLQNELEANPPTILFGLELLMQGIDQSHPEYNTLIDFFNSGVEGKLLRWFRYFNATQRNHQVEGDKKYHGPMFKWACIEPCEGSNLLGSGLDDYPRTNGLDEPLASLDLQVWMVTLVRTINSIANFKGNSPKPQFVELENKLIESLKDFYDEKDNMYKDLTQNPLGTEYGTRVKIYSDHVGYINLFPMIFGLAPKGGKEIKKILSILKDPKALWSEYGIRSLAQYDLSFLKGDQYWTEPVWININYLILKALKTHYWQEPGAAELYTKLRENIIKVVTDNWFTTGTFWENYSSINGKGQKSRGFTGWSSLIVLIMSEIY